MTTEVSGSAPVIWVAAEMPLPGMLISRRQTSGRSRWPPRPRPRLGRLDADAEVSGPLERVAHQGAGSCVVIGQ